MCGLLPKRCIMPKYNNEFDDQYVSQSIELLDSEDNVWPKLSDEAINKVTLVGDIVNTFTDDSEVDPAAILFTLLSGFGAAVGTGPHLKIGETRHPARINAVLVGSSSRARKGTSEHPIRRLLELAHDEAKLPMLNITSGALSSGEGLIYAVRDAAIDDDNKDIGVLDKRLWSIEAEFANVLRVSKREGNTLSTIIRNAWDGGVISPLTKNNIIRATDPHISILGHITQEELSRVLNFVETWNGFANRFLWICVQRKKKIPLPMPVNQTILSVLSKSLGDSLCLAKRLKQISLAPEALEYWSFIYNYISRDMPGRLGVITSRAEAHTLRLSIAYALLDGKDMIWLPHLEAAQAAWQYSEASTRFLFAQSEHDPDTDKILQALFSTPMSTTEIHELFSRHKKAAELSVLLRKLQMTNKIIAETVGGGQGKGKGTTIWRMVENI